MMCEYIPICDQTADVTGPLLLCTAVVLLEILKRGARHHASAYLRMVSAPLAGHMGHQAALLNASVLYGMGTG